MIRVLEVVLGGGGALGALAAWLTAKWLNAREAKRRARPAVVRPRDLDKPWPLPAPELPFVPPPPPPGACQRVYGYHTCILPPRHEGDHICTCFRLPGPHHFS